MKFTNLTYLIIAIVIIGCNNMSYSPYAFDPNSNLYNLNESSIERINTHIFTPSDTISFILLGDVQNFYDETFDIVQFINETEDVDFLIQDGDFTDFGTEAEFQEMNNILSGLEVPYLTVLGNHDCIANGVHIYKRMFGSLNYSFIVNRLKFVFINTNSREFNFNGSAPDIEWLEKELMPDTSFDYAVVTCHVPPVSFDFDKNLYKDFIESLSENSNVLMELNGHRHGYNYSEFNEVPYINSISADEKSYIRINICKNKFSHEVIYTDNLNSNI